MSDGPEDAAARLYQITDDLSPREEWRQWLVREMWAGRDPDVLLGELVSNGWAQSEAEGLVEEARQQTRGARSVMGARNEIARVAQQAPRPRTVLPAPDHGTALLASVVLGIARGIQWVISSEAREVWWRVKEGRCYKCGYDVKASGDQRPACGSPVIRREL